MTEKKQIEQMLIDGMKPKDIADTLKINKQRVYNVKYHMNKDENKTQELPKQPKEETVPKEKYEKLESKLGALEQEFSFEEKQWKKAMEGQIDEQLHQQIVDEKDRIIESLEEEVKRLRNLPQQPVGSFEEEYKGMIDKYETVKAKHDKLLEYITIQ